MDRTAAESFLLVSVWLLFLILVCARKRYWNTTKLEPLVPTQFIMTNNETKQKQRARPPATNNITSLVVVLVALHTPYTILHYTLYYPILCTAHTTLGHTSVEYSNTIPYKYATSTYNELAGAAPWGRHPLLVGKTNDKFSQFKRYQQGIHLYYSVKSIKI